MKIIGLVASGNLYRQNVLQNMVCVDVLTSPNTRRSIA